jgi:hypothetical protein
METPEAVQAAPEQKLTLDAAQKLAVRDAQFAVVAAKELVQTKQNELMALIQGLAKSAGFSDSEKVNFDLATLEFKKV